MHFSHQVPEKEPVPFFSMTAKDYPRPAVTVDLVVVTVVDAQLKVLLVRR